MKHYLAILAIIGIVLFFTISGKETVDANPETKEIIARSSSYSIGTVVNYARDGNSYYVSKKGLFEIQKGEGEECLSAYECNRATCKRGYCTKTMVGSMLDSINIFKLWRPTVHDECIDDSACDDLDFSTRDVCVGDIFTQCFNFPITECISSDNFCPDGCYTFVDSDCICERNDDCGPILFCKQGACVVREDACVSNDGVCVEGCLPYEDNDCLCSSDYECINDDFATIGTCVDNSCTQKENTLCRDYDCFCPSDCTPSNDKDCATGATQGNVYCSGTCLEDSHCVDEKPYTNDWCSDFNYCLHQNVCINRDGTCGRYETDIESEFILEREITCPAHVDSDCEESCTSHKQCEDEEAHGGCVTEYRILNTGTRKEISYCKHSDEIICDHLEDEGNIENCKFVEIRHGNTAYTCEEIGNKELKFKCFKELAMLNLDISYCDYYLNNEPLYKDCKDFSR